MEAPNNHEALQRHSFPVRRLSVDESGERLGVQGLV